VQYPGKVVATQHVKFVKGMVLEAVSNEIFYSFHKDDILAASLLHPCKVAFM
jgi:hypothetical protein